MIIMEISPKRILYLDEVRSLAIILVVIGHLSRLFVHDFTGWQFCTGVFALTRIGVPLFFTVSGALLLVRKHDIEKFLKKRFKRVILPFAFWIIVYLAAGVLIWHYQFSLGYVFNTTFGVDDYSSIFWFIWSLIGVYLLIPVLSSFIREYSDFGSKYLILITVILSLLYTVGFFNHEQIKYNFKLIFYFFSVLGYFIIGSYIQNHKFSLSQNKLFVIGIALFVIGYLGHFSQIYMKGVAGMYLAPVDFFNIFVIMETAGIFLIFKNASFKMIGDNIKPLRQRKIAELIVLFSSCSFGIYFSHYILLMFFAYNTALKILTTFNPFIALPVFSVILILSSWILIWVMSKIPVLVIGSGVK